jgi:cytochrome c biogenesis protein CcmG/thiol:disulfide interchange protein DsbE
MMKITIMKEIIITVLSLCLFASSSLAALKPNEIAPTFSLPDSKGKDFSLGDYVGAARKENVKGVILSFFATWCLECRNELPLINALVDELGGKGIKVVIVDVKEDFDSIAALLSELKVDKPVVLSDRYGKTAEKYGVRFLPATFFIGADARVKHIIFGGIHNAQELREGAGKLLP